MKNYQKLSRSEMKNLLGGTEPMLAGDGTVTCSTTCSNGREIKCSGSTCASEDGKYVSCYISSSESHEIIRCL